MSTITHASNSKPCHFLALSAELRNEVYKILAEHHVDAATVDISTSRVNWGNEAFSFANTCTLIKAEYTSLFYGMHGLRIIIPIFSKSNRFKEQQNAEYMANNALDLLKYVGSGLESALTKAKLLHDYETYSALARAQVWSAVHASKAMQNLFDNEITRWKPTTVNIYLGTLQLGGDLDTNQFSRDWDHIQTSLRRIGKSCSGSHLSFDLQRGGAGAVCHIDCSVNGPASLASQLEAAYFTPQLRTTLMHGELDDRHTDEFIKLEKNILWCLYPPWYCQQEAKGKPVSRQPVDEWFLIDEKDLHELLWPGCVWETPGTE